MPDSQARTKAGKQRFVSKAMHEFGKGEMKSGSGQKVTDPKQAIAIALSQTGQSRGQSRDQRVSGKNGGNNGNNGRIARTISQRLDRGQNGSRTK